MTLLAVPNISEGRDPARIAACMAAVVSAGAHLLDVHTDAVHNRSVLTIAAPQEVLINASVELAHAATQIDLRLHDGVHPRLGGLDVCPFVPHGDTAMDEAIAAARSAAVLIGAEVGLPVFLYDQAATRTETAALPLLRRGGLSSLAARMETGLIPDAGPLSVDPARGVVCVGARGPLIAFNVWARASLKEAKELAARARSSTVRALGLEISRGVCQVSMNLIDPATRGIADAFEAVAKAADAAGIRITATEVVGLVEARFLPGPETTATRLLMEPGRSVEEALELVR